MIRLSSMAQALLRLLLGQRGNIAFTFALAAPVLLAAIGAAVDVATLASKRAILQAAADEASLMGAKQLAIANTTDASIKAQVVSLLAQQLTPNDTAATHTVTIDRAKQQVTVAISEVWSPLFAQLLMSGITPVGVHATGQFQVPGATAANVCILLLDPSAKKSLWIDNMASINASGCSIYANSSDTQSIFVTNKADIKTASMCAVGGIKTGPLTAINVTPQQDCPPFPDPLASVAGLPTGPCINNMVVTTGTAAVPFKLSKGTYCGGLKITGSAYVKFDPGEYVIIGGPLTIDSNATVIGTNVAFFLSGASANLKIAGNATINLAGAETGPLAGILFYADRSTTGLSHEINATNVQTITGTIYLPTGYLKVDPSAVVGQQSAYTAIIAASMELVFGPTLIMNTNYSATKVPVPTGLKPSATPNVTLVD